MVAHRRTVQTIGVRRAQAGAVLEHSPPCSALCTLTSSACSKSYSCWYNYGSPWSPARRAPCSHEGTLLFRRSLLICGGGGVPRKCLRTQCVRVHCERGVRRKVAAARSPLHSVPSAQEGPYSRAAADHRHGHALPSFPCLTLYHLARHHQHQKDEEEEGRGMRPAAAQTWSGANSRYGTSFQSAEIRLWTTAAIAHPRCARHSRSQVSSDS